MGSHLHVTRAACMKESMFDGSSWCNYYKQFKAVARTNGLTNRKKAVTLTASLRRDATDVLYAIPVENVEEYDFLVRRTEIQYEAAHLDSVYCVQLKTRQ